MSSNRLGCFLLCLISSGFQESFTSLIVLLAANSEGTHNCASGGQASLVNLLLQRDMLARDPG